MCVREDRRQERREDGGRRKRKEEEGGADTELKTKTPHVNVGNKLYHFKHLHYL